MNSTIVQHLIQRHNISYLITNSDLTVTEAQGSADLSMECIPANIGRSLPDVVPELIGIEDELAAIMAGKKEFLCLETVNRDREGDQVTYVRMTELAKRNSVGAIEGIIHLIEDVTIDGKLQQEATQKHNEALLVQQTLSHSNLELQALNAELAQINELHSILISMATHEIRGALTTVQAYLGLLEDEIQNHSANSMIYLERVQQGVTRLRRLITTLLDMVLIELGQLEILLTPVDLLSLVEETLELLQPQFEAKSHNVTIQAEENLPLALGDQIRVGQIIDNLLSNAIKYTPDEGQIQISLKAQDDGEHILVAVSDNGIGIKPENVGNLFDRFFRSEEARQQGQGFGLGLYIVHVLVELHGGDIWVESTPHAGSTFTVRLSMAKTDMILNRSSLLRM